MILNGFLTFNFVWNNQIKKKIKWFLSYTQETGFRRSGIIAKQIKSFNSKFCTTNSKTNILIVFNSQICIFRTDWKLTRQIAFRRVGLVHHRYRLYMFKNKHFLFYRPYKKKSLVSEILRCLKILLDCGIKLCSACN